MLENLKTIRNGEQANKYRKKNPSHLSSKGEEKKLLIVNEWKWKAYKSHDQHKNSVNKSNTKAWGYKEKEKKKKKSYVWNLKAIIGEKHDFYGYEGQGRKWQIY